MSPRGGLSRGTEADPTRSGTVTREWLERFRDAAFRRCRPLRVRTAQDATRFVEAVGVCSTFHRFRDGLACLWEAVAGQRDPSWPRHSHHDPGVALTWQLKDTLPARRAVYYGRLLKGRPVLVALDLFPAFYALVRGRQRARDYRVEYEAGRLSYLAKRLMDALIRRRPLYTREWRAEALLLDPSSTRGFERAVAELQQALFVVKVEERYEPSFSYRWDLVEAWLPDAVREGRRLRRAAAVHRLLERYLRGAGWASRRGLARLFGLPLAEIDAAVAGLVASRAVQTGVGVPGLPGDLVIHQSAVAGGSPTRSSTRGHGRVRRRASATR